MVNILIFRTDRIGDLIVTCPAILTIKKFFINSKITLITSDYNYLYAKSLNIFDEIYNFPKTKALDKFYLVKKLKNKKFDYLFIFDGKDRSFISSIFINCKNKFAISSKKNFVYKLFNIKFFEDNEKTHLYAIFQEILDYCQISSKINNFDFLKYKVDNQFSKNLPIKKYIHIHLDEKWNSNQYIRSYTDINPSYEAFIDLINSLSLKNNVLITTGLLDTDLILALKNNYFIKNNDKIFYKKLSNKFIYFVYKPTFEDIESLLRNSQLLITCHGAITHAANSFDVKKIDIIEKNRNKFYKRFTTYLNNYHPIYRSSFDILKDNLLNIARD